MARKARKKELNYGHYIEAQHMSYVCQDFVETHLADHHLFQHPDNKDLLDKVMMANSILADVYQEVAKLLQEKFPDGK